ncbi:MAG: sugar-binding domain-containing protein [Mariniphaga sp.]
MKKIELLGFLFLLLFTCCSNKVENKIDLSGTWKFAVDPNDKGITEKWFSKPLSDQVTLPGSMTSNGKGDDITLNTAWTGQIVDSSYFKSPDYAKYREPGNIKIPFWLQSVKHYQGAAWYQREVDIPKDWVGQNISLFLERCHWETKLWIDNQEIGMRNSLGTPHIYDLTSKLAAGKHTLTICVDNRTKEIDPGLNSHSISDHTQTNWNGMVGKLILEARPKLTIRSIQVYPDVQNKRISVKVSVGNPTGNLVKVKMNIKVTGASNPDRKSSNYILNDGENILSMTYQMEEDCKLWNEFHPNLYKLVAEITDQNSGITDKQEVNFGMREFKAVGKQIQINGQPTFLRGTLECAIFPKTGYPPTSTSEWLRIFNICRAHGLNHMRFHSWCPPNAAFEAADQAGFYLQVECSSWANSSTTLGDGNPFDKYLYEESQRMVENYGNHPSFCMMLYGNEPAGKNQVQFLTDFVNFWKKKDSRRIYTSGAGWPNLEVNDYLSSPNPRIQGWGEQLKSIINRAAPTTDYDWSSKIATFKQPVVSHEIGQWCVYPNFKEIVKYDGVLRAKNFEIFQETLKDNGMAQLADTFLLASGKLQALCYKADIEAALRTPGFGGFQLLDLHDFPGQGSALVGVLDAFWDEKGYITPKEYSRFCNSTVPLARLKKQVFTNNETFEASVEVAHFGDEPISACTPEWKITGQNGKIIQSGKLPVINIELGNCIQIGKVAVPLASVASPEKLTFEVSVNGFANSWELWVYPQINAKVEGVDKIKLTPVLDKAALDFLQQGGSVLLTLKKGTLKPEFGGNIGIGFSSIFWNTAWTRGQAPHTLGILCNPKHPALEEFPTEYYSNWQWWDAMSHSNAINMATFPSGLQPIVRVIDDWFKNRPLALVFEAKVGKGKIVVSGIDFNEGLETRPEAKQMLYSLTKYMAGNQFNPKVELTGEKIISIIQ